METEAINRTTKNYESFVKRLLGPLTVKITKCVVDDNVQNFHFRLKKLKKSEKMCKNTKSFLKCKKNKNENYCKGV